MADVDLTTAIKQAKSKKMFFALIPKGTDGTLLVSKAKIPAKEIAEAKKESGGGTPILGKVTGPIGNLVFMVAKAAPPTMEAALKKIVKRDAALSIVPVIQIAGDAESDEEDAGDAAAGAAPAGAAAPAAPPAPPAAPKAPAAPGVLGIQKALQKLGFDPGTIDGVDGPKTQAAIKKFQQANGLAADGVAGAKTQAALAKALAGGGGAGGGPAAPPTPPPATGPAKSPPTPAAKLNLGPWQAARQTAINDLKALAAKVAATKHGTAADVLKEIQSIIARLPASPAPKDIDKLEDFVRKDETITAAEKVPSHFHDLNIREPLLKALETLKQ